MMDSEKRKTLREALDRAGSIEALMEEMARSESEEFKKHRDAVESGTHPSEDQLYDYVLGSLSGPAATVILKHISLCRGCLQEVIRMRALEDDLVDADLEWAEATPVLMNLINWLRSLVSRDPLDFEMLNPATAAAGVRSPVSGFLIGLASLTENAIMGELGNGVSNLIDPLRGPGTRERQKIKRSTFKVGDPLLFSVSIPADGHLIVFHYNGTDRLALVFPSNSGQDSAVSTGEIKRIPGHVNGPAGQQFLKAIWTIDPLINPNDIHFSDQDSIEKALEDCFERLGKLKPDQWREVLCEFEVHDE
jgi:hypothetical protein